MKSPNETIAASLARRVKDIDSELVMTEPVSVCKKMVWKDIEISYYTKSGSITFLKKTKQSQEFCELLVAPNSLVVLSANFLIVVTPENKISSVDVREFDFNPQLSAWQTKDLSELSDMALTSLRDGRVAVSGKYKGEGRSPKMSISLLNPHISQHSLLKSETDAREWSINSIADLADGGVISISRIIKKMSHDLCHYHVWNARSEFVRGQELLIENPFFHSRSDGSPILVANGLTQEAFFHIENGELKPLTIVIPESKDSSITCSAMISGNILICGYEKGAVKVFDLNQKKHLRTRNYKDIPITAIAAYDDAKFIIGYGSVVHVIDLKTYEPVQTINLPFPCKSLQVLPDSTINVCGENQSVLYRTRVSFGPVAEKIQPNIKEIEKLEQENARLKENAKQDNKENQLPKSVPVNNVPGALFEKYAREDVKKSAITIQRVARGFFARKKFTEMKKDDFEKIKKQAEIFIGNVGTHKKFLLVAEVASAMAAPNYDSLKKIMGKVDAEISKNSQIELKM